MFLFYFLVIDFVNCQPEFNQEDFFDRPVSPWERQHRPPWHHGPPPPPWRRRPPPPWLRGPPPPWHHGPPPPLPPWAGPPLFPPPPPPLLPSNQESSVQFSPSIDKVVNSVNRNTAAFQKPGESYDRVIQLMATFFNRKSNSQYDVSKNIPQNGISNNEASYNSKIAAAMFESDMVLTVGQINEITNNNNKRIKRKININGTTWGTRISYQFLDTDVTWQSHINNALRFYELNTCIRFVLNEASADYIVFNKGEGCYSSVGKLGGPQEVSIGNGCESLGIITHEVGHSLGFWHEQARPERDSYVRINRQNAVSGLEGQFEKRTWAEVANYNIPYDYGSVMHYSSKAFSQSSNLNTIEPFDMAFLSTIGNRNEPTFLDLKALNLAFYICPNVINCLNSGYPDPNNCGRCKCPTGLEGLYCEKLQTSSCGVEVPRIDYKWQTITYSGSSDCYWRISAPSNSMKIRYHLTHVMYKCSPACEEFVEIKAEQNHETTGFRHCCRVDIGERVSKNDNILIISKATTTSQFVLKYRIDGAPPVKNIPIPPTSTYNSQWSAWTACTENCGACGTQYRQRCTSANCINPITQTRVCNKQPCSPGTTKRTEKSLARYKRYGGEWCCARFVLSGRVCVPVRTG